MSDSLGFAIGEPPTRYELLDQPADMSPAEDGEWVRWADVAHLWSEVAASPAPLREAGALERFNRDPDLLANETPLERLRYFCSLAMNGQDWLDVEPFFAALAAQLAGIEADGDGGKGLHAAIMNLPCNPVTDDGLTEEANFLWLCGYRYGHRDARHAAAELALSPTSPPNGKTEGDGAAAVPACDDAQPSRYTCAGIMDPAHHGITADGVDVPDGGQP
jgi:hypothetical protein